MSDEYDIPALKNVTTRSRRPGERDGVDYLFVTAGEFRRMRDEGLLLEWVEYSGNLYGLKRTEDLRGVTVLETEGARRLKAMFPDKVRIVYLEVPEQIRMERMLDRGDSPQKAHLRIARDRERFEDSGLKQQADLVVCNIDMASAVKKILPLFEGNS